MATDRPPRRDAPTTILVTGGAGFIGSHLVQHLAADGRSVTVLDNLDPYYDTRIKRGNLDEIAKAGDVAFVEGDIRDDGLLARLFAEKAFEAVVHLAALAGVRSSIERPAAYASVNVDGTVKVLEAARRGGARRFVLASSSSVYGLDSKGELREDDRCDRQISPYGATKRAAELMAHAYHALHGLQVWALRFFTAYGPRQRPDMAIHKFVRAALDGAAITMFGDGSALRDYTYVDDIVQGVIAAVDTEVGYEIVNLGRGHAVRLDELLKVVQDATGRPLRIERIPVQPGDMDATLASIEKAEKLLNYCPRTDLASGVQGFVEWSTAQRRCAAE